MVYRITALWFLLASTAHATGVETVGLIGAIVSTVATFAVANAVQIAFVAYALYSSSKAKRSKRADADRQKAETLANLQDRTANVLSGEAPLQVIYGEPAPVGGAIAAVLTSGSADEWKHVVIVFAAHEVTSFDQFYLDGAAIPLLSNGDAFGNEWGPALTFHNAPWHLPNTSQVITVLNVPVVRTGILDAFGNYPELPVGTVVQAYVVGADTTDDNSVVQNFTNATYLGASQFLVTPYTGTFSGFYAIPYVYQSRFSYVKITTFRGNGVDPGSARLTAAAPEWTANHKLSGLAYAVVSLNMSHPRLQNPVKITAKIKGKPVYDYVTGLTTYSRNPANCLADYLRSDYGYGASASQLDANNWQQAALSCADTSSYSYGTPQQIADRNAALNGLQRYTCDGSFTTDQDRESILTQLEDSFAAQAYRSGGIWRVSPGAWAVPIKTLNPKDALAPIDVKQASNSTKSRYNTIRGTYIASDSLGSPQEYPAYINYTWLTSDGVEKATTANYVFTGRAQRCRDLSRIIIEKARGGLTVEYAAKMNLWALQPGDRVWINDASFGFVNKSFLIVDWVQNAQSPVTLQCVEDVPSIYDLADEVLLDPSQNTTLPNPFAPILSPRNLALSSGTGILHVLSDGSVVSRTKLTWTPSTDSGVTSFGGSVSLRVKEATRDAVWSETTTLPGTSSEYFFDNLLDSHQYVFEVWFSNAINVLSPVASALHIQVGKTEPPKGVPLLTASVTNTGIRLSFPENNEVDSDVTWLRRGTSWAASLPIGPGSQEIKLITTDWNAGWLPAGVQSYVAKYVDTSGIESLTAAAVSVNILAPALPVISTNPKQDFVELRWQDTTTTQPIDFYEIKQGSVESTAEFLGTVSARFKLLQVRAAGTYRYWVRGKDVGGNYGPWGSADAMLNNPPGYTIKDKKFLTFNGVTYTNAQKVMLQGVAFVEMLVNLGQTVAQRFTPYTTVSGKNAAGDTYVFQPGVTSAVYEEVIDFLAPLPAATATLSYQSELLGSPAVVASLSTKVNLGDSWTDYLGQTVCPTAGRRYIKVRFTSAGVGGDDYVAIKAAALEIVTQTITLTKVLNITDTVTTNGQRFEFSAIMPPGWFDIQNTGGIQITPAGSTPLLPSWIVDVDPNPAGLWVRLQTPSGVRATGLVTLSVTGIASN
jgi:hypothetical protein